ncbi:suppressor of los1-1 [Apophysomyces ossiformis]|uniref:6-phosphogluconolactonase n=1 Tax=Apophysomyces ossiformis TaxID=679940 RepID=A0A8H7ESE2_9FUNG|nr:suppressor of los1-1 [Apophysomyces ossiformis]
MTSTVYAFPTTDDLSLGLNDFVEKLSRDAIAARGAFTVAVSGGSLPKLLSKELIHNTNVDFNKWHVFWADERCVPLDHADSNYLEVKKTLFDHVPQLPAQNLHTIHPEYATAKLTDKAADDYEQQLKAYFGKLPRFDLILLGMGPDGHCCSLFPGHPLLNEKERWAAPIVDSPKPPPERITLTYPVVNNAEVIAFVTAGEGKQEMVQKILEQPQLELPCQRVQPTSGRVFWFIDQAAAGKLSNNPSTYKL